MNHTHLAEWTGQPYLTEVNDTVACLVCGKAITTRSNAWYDSYVPSIFNKENKGGYVCKEHLSQQRKDEINTDRPADKPENFEAEKDWVERTQTDSTDKGPLMGMLKIVGKYQNDPVIQNGIKEVFKAVAELK